MKQAVAMSKAQSAYALGIQRLRREKTVCEAELLRWSEIDRNLLALHQDTKELLWYSGRRISRDYASSESGLGKFPKTQPSED
jgi:hypothetical protein